MKMRQGFVSNSSSSSFYIRGNVEVNEVEDFLQKILNLYNEAHNDVGKDGLKIDDICYVYKLTKKEINYVREKYPMYSGYDMDEHMVAVSTLDDNSVPHVVFEFLQEKFSGSYFHWG